MSDELLSFNGINAETGDYLLQVEPQDLAKVACKQTLDKAMLSELKRRHQSANETHYGVVQGVDVNDLAQAGWGVIFAAAKPDTPQASDQQAVADALAPLFALRRQQATQQNAHFYKEYRGGDGYRHGESKQAFLARLGAGPGPADPHKVPYYLLIVGDPEAIPYRIQSQIGVQYAVGRIWFDNLDSYSRYAASVVAAETGQVAVARRATFFGVANNDDRATQSSAEHLIAPLAAGLAAHGGDAWDVQSVVGDAATRQALGQLINGGNTPALLFTASHGMGFPNGAKPQLGHQGALLCQDWPGPKAWRGKKIPTKFYFSADDVSEDASLAGSMAFLFACYGAGTPQHDEFYRIAFKERSEIAPRPFVSRLPMAMLDRPCGGALAVVGHVERAWGTSFMWAGTGKGGSTGRQLGTFESTLRSLMGGMPIGAAMEYFDERYAELSTDLTVQLEEIDYGAEFDAYEVASMWTANNDARGYAILGDPAVRLPLAEEGQPARRPSGLLVVPHVSAAPVSAPLSGLTETASPEGLPEGSDMAALGLFGGNKKDDEPSAFQKLSTRVADALGRALDDATSLEVATWVATDLDQAKFEDGKMTGAHMRAFTRISLDGDTVVCLPERDGEVDKEVWEIHREMVHQAQETRTELMKTLVSAVAGLGKIIS